MNSARHGLNVFIWARTVASNGGTGHTVPAHVPPTLEETIAQLEATLESTHDGIIVVSLDRRMVRWNGRFVEMFDLPAAMVARANAAEMIAHVATQLDESDARTLPSDELWSLDATHLRRLRFTGGR